MDVQGGLDEQGEAKLLRRAECLAVLPPKLGAANVLTNFGVKFWQTTTLIEVGSHFFELLLGAAMGVGWLWGARVANH